MLDNSGREGLVEQAASHEALGKNPMEAGHRPSTSSVFRWRTSAGRITCVVETASAYSYGRIGCTCPTR
jgi:hypothetical protein